MIKIKEYVMAESLEQAYELNQKKQKLYHWRHAVAEDGKPDGSDSHRSVQSGTEYHRGK